MVLLELEQQLSQQVIKHYNEIIQPRAQHAKGPQTGLVNTRAMAANTMAIIAKMKVATEPKAVRKEPAAPSTI